jgi:hypothetical protein
MTPPSRLHLPHDLSARFFYYHAVILGLAKNLSSSSARLLGSGGAPFSQVLGLAKPYARFPLLSIAPLLLSSPARAVN